MTRLEVTQDPAAVGMDARRLARIDRVLGRYVDDGRLAGWQVVVRRRGQVVHSSVCGQRDLEARLPVEPDTLWRIYSMTKPVTSVAAMSLYEEGAFALTDEVSQWIPSFADARALVGGTVVAPKTAPLAEPVRLWHLLTHTSGLTYGFTRSSLVDEMYRAAGSDFAQPAGMSLAAMCDVWAGLPLLFQPGTGWNYGVSTDVLGRVLEVVTGSSLDEVVRDRVLDPLGMRETGWWVEGADTARLAALYVPDPGTRRALRYDVLGDAALSRPDLLSGGGGLVSTAADYDRFTRMLLDGGELDGVRVLGPRTLAYMTRNHLPDGATLADLARGQFAETVYQGVGFGLGFGVLQDPTANKVLASAGEYTWGGAASTAFYVDPVEQVTVAFYTQLVPSSTYPIRSQLRQLVAQAIMD